ncbi:unnamed protein product [Schistosoma rodhaini]|nr:unnamed protein product [Schistosoma rodhaini]
MSNNCHLSLTETKLITIGVIGLPGSGKSCFCNRFVFRHPDSYVKDPHPISNTSHSCDVNVCDSRWLYWGCACRQIDGSIIKFQILEHTKFPDGVSYSVPQYSTCDHDINQFLEYIHKSIEIRLVFKNKLTYACKKGVCKGSSTGDCFGSNEVEVDGFILIFDITTCTSNTHCVDPSYSCNSAVLQESLKCFSRVRKPAVVVLSKLDNCDFSKSGLDTFLKSNEFKKIPVIETSAHENVNIEEAFFTLYRIMESKTRVNKLRHISYAEAAYKRSQVVDSAMRSFVRLVFISLPEFLTNWETFMGRYSHHTDVVNYIDLVGSLNARYKFEAVVEERFRKKKLNSLDKVPGILMHLLPNLDTVHGFSFEQIVSYIRRHKEFSLCFQDDTYYDCSTDLNNVLHDDSRVPFHLAIEPIAESENCLLKQHMDRLTNIRRRHTEKAFLETSLHHGFRNCLTSTMNEDHSDEHITVILPGQPLSDVKSNISSLDLLALTKEEISGIYQQFQLGLHIRVREDFLDLLVEQTEIFVKTVLGYLDHLRDSYPYITHALDSVNGDYSEPSSKINPDLLTSRKLSTFDQNLGVQTAPSPYVSINRTKYLSAPPRGVKETQINWLSEQLSKDDRYQAMAYLPSERQTLITAYFDMLIPSIDSHRFIPRSPSNDILTVDFRAVQNPRSPMASNEMDSPVIDNASCLDPTADYYSESYRFESSYLCSPCLSVSCGGCVDVLFKQLAHEYLPGNFVYSREQFINFSESNSNYFCLDKSMLSIPRSSTPQIPSLSCLPLSVYDHSPLVLSIAIACICTDTLAAHAVINLLSCAGFCMASFISKTSEHSVDHRSDHYHDYHHRNQYTSLKPSTLYPSEENSTSDPLVLTATWPLPTTRLFMSGSSSTPIPNPSIISSFKDIESLKIYDGQVHIHLMSHHTLLNKLLLYRENITSKSEQSNGILLEGSDMNLGTTNSHFLPYSGIILFTSAPSAAQKKLWNELSQETGEIFPPTHLSTKLQGRVTNSMNLCGINMHECSSSPQLLLNDHSPDENECDFKAHAECDHSSEFPCSFDQLSCTCCNLFYNKKEINTLGCVCGQCCNCVHSSKNSNNSSLLHIKPDTWKDKRLHSSLMCPHRRRSWEARVAAINSIVDQVPRNIPHLVLLTESSYYGGKSEDIPPSIYPATGSIRSSTFSRQSYPDMSCDQSENSSSSLNRESCSSDWMPVGTNILDHVINFLSHCWNKMNQNVSSKYVGKYKNTCRFTTSKNSEISNSPSSPHLMVTGSYANQSSVEISLDKSFSGGLLNTLSVASATGRKAMHSANQALRKLSNTAKYHHNCKSSPATNSKGFLSSFIDSHGKVSVNEKSQTMPEQVSFVSNSKSKTLESMHSPGTLIASNDNPITISSPPAIQTNESFSEHNHTPKRFNCSEHPIRWKVGPSPLHTHRKESSIRKATEKLQSKAFHLKKINLKSTNDKIISLTKLTNFGVDSTPLLLPVNVQDSEKTTPTSKGNTYLQTDMFISKLSAAQSPDKIPCCEDREHNIHSIRNSYIGLFDKCCHCMSDVPEDNLNIGINKQNTRQVIGGSTSNISVTPIDISTSSHSQNRDETTKELLKSPNKLENQFTSTTMFNDNNYLIASKSLDSNHCLINSSLHNHSTDMFCIMQSEEEKQDDIESIYEEFILTNGSSQPSSSSLSSFSDTHTTTNNNNYNNSSNTGYHSSRVVSPPSLTAPTNISNADEHIYMEPVDCLTYGCLERYHIIPQKFTDFYTNLSNSSAVVSNKQEFNNSTLSIHPTGVVTSSNVSNNWTENDVGYRRERYRSFSTPEGSSLSHDSNETQYGGGPSVGSSSNINFPRNIFQPFSGNPIHFRSVRSSHLNGSSNISPLKTRIHSTDAVFESLTHYNTSVISPASTTLSEDLNENVMISDKFPRFSTIRAQSLPNPLSRLHHHHFWHHPKCPHYRIHRDSEDSGLGTASSSSSKFGFQSQLSTDYNHINYCNKMYDTDTNKSSSEFLSPINLSQQLPCKSYSPSYSCAHFHCSNNSTSYNISSTPSKPVFIDPTDFQTHQPTQSSLTFPSYNHLSFNTTSTTITSDNTAANNATPHMSSMVYHRNTYYQPSQAPCNHNISTFAATKDFKWLRRNKPLKFFGHRFSLETQPNSSPSTTPASSVPQSAPPPPPFESYLPPFTTPKKSMSTMNNCSSTLHSKSNLSGNNNLTGSLCFETQQVPVTRNQSSVRNMAGFSLFVNNISNNTLKSVFSNHHDNTKTTTTATIVSSFRHQ